MNEAEGTAAIEQNSPAAEAESKYTRNHPYYSTVVANYLLSGEDSEKETRHLAFSLEPGMTYTPGDAIGVIPDNRAQAVAEVLAALGFTGDERVLDHYKVEISFEEALRTRLTIGKLARGCVGNAGTVHLATDANMKLSGTLDVTGETPMTSAPCSITGTLAGVPLDH